MRPCLKRATALLIVGLVSSLVCHGRMSADEGMWPVSEIRKLDLAAKGFELSAEDIFSPDRASLIYAVVKVGATGSFVSPDGLILTNHHVAFGAAQAASTPEHDYIRHGFLARTQEQEVTARGMTARITESFRDVSGEVLKAVKPGLDPVRRTEAVRRRIREIAAAAEKANPGKRAEVAEMFPGRTYFLFIYTDLKDIRLVYVPPRSIGEFGGETDNWMWPRHTGDFSFLRAYVAPDGSPAEFSKENVPFKPKRFLRVAPRGAMEDDLVFLLGYPGRTYRHMTSHFLAYEEEVRMPYVADWYEWQIGLMEKAGRDDRAVALKLASRVKGLANTMKNYRGKLQGMKRVGIVERKREEERRLQEFIERDPARRAAAGGLLGRFAEVYDDMRRDAERDMLVSYLRSQVALLNVAAAVHEAALERPKPDLERRAEYTDRNFPQTRKRLELAVDNAYVPVDKEILRELLLRASRLDGKLGIPFFDRALSGPDADKAVAGLVDGIYSGSRLLDRTGLAELLKMTPAELEASNDPAVKAAAALYPAVSELRKKEDARNGLLNELYPRLLEVKQAFQAGDFIPDANGTLRFTFGRVKGYRPRDAVYYAPFTSLQGVLEKTTGQEPFDTPERLINLIKQGDFGAYKPQGFPGVPVCLLYDADTTGGNSGSPVLNSRGELVGVNFDRTFEATINDYAWSPDYSRSIAVDIRYVLWVTERFAEADFLLREMGVK